MTSKTPRLRLDTHGAKWWRVPAGLPTCARRGGGSAPSVGEPRQCLCQAPRVGAIEKKIKPNLPSEGTRRGVAGRGVAGWTKVGPLISE